MKLSAKIWQAKDGFWTVEIDEVGLSTQGYSEDDARMMLTDLVEFNVAQPGFKVTVTSGEGREVFVEANDPVVFAAWVEGRKATL